MIRVGSLSELHAFDEETGAGMTLCGYQGAVRGATTRMTEDDALHETTCGPCRKVLAQRVADAAMDRGRI